MKKIISVFLSLILVFSLAACSGNNDEIIKSDSDIAMSDADKETSAQSDISQEIEKEEIPQKENQENTQQKPNQNNQTTPETKPQENKPQENKPQQEEQTPKTVGYTLLSDFKSKAASSSSALSLAKSIASNPVIKVSADAMSVEPGYLTGFDNAEIKGFKDGAMFAPMIGTIPFIGYVFILEDGTDATSFISTLKSSANLRWNICTSADEMVSGSVGNKVFFVMSPLSFDQE